MLSTVEHSYACSILKQRGITIFRNGERILDQRYPFRFPKLDTYLKVGDNFLADNEQELKKIDKDYDELKKLGWKISSREATGAFFDYQRLQYFLCPGDSPYHDYGSIPKDHYVVIDFNNQAIKFYGKNVAVQGASGWMYLRPYAKVRRNESAPNPFQTTKLIAHGHTYLENIMPEYARTQKENWIKIPEAVMGISEHGEIVCLEKTKDAPVVAIAGQRGTGKSMLENGIEGELYHKLDYNLFNVNDVKYDTQTRCMPWNRHKDTKFIKDLMRYNEPSIPLPYIYLHPTFKGIKENDILYKDEVGFEVSFPFKDFLLDTNLMKYNKQWKTSDASRKYIRDLIEDNKGNERVDGLLYLNDLDDIKSLVDNTIPQEIAGTRASIFSLVKDVFSRNILDRTSKINSKWIAKIGDEQYAYTPWNICLACGLVPSFITAQARKYDWFSMYMKFVLEDTFKFKKSKIYQKLQGKHLMLCGDEFVSMLRDKDTRAIIDEVIREGRTDDIGFNLVVQHYQDIPNAIITNITHHFVFNTKAPDDLNYLKKEHNLTKTRQNEIGRLKKFQCMAFGEFILYDTNGQRYSNQGEPVKIIKIKFPNAQHYGGSGEEAIV
jgi:hypothetical protein